MSQDKSQRRAPQSARAGASQSSSSNAPDDSQQYQSARGCLLLIGIAVVSLALALLAALLLGKFD